MFKKVSEKSLLKVIAEMFFRFAGGKAKRGYLDSFQKNVESEINKGYDLLKSINLVFHK
jgi:hypothetical protein